MKKKDPFKISYLIFAWVLVLVLIAVSVIVSLAKKQEINYAIINGIISFAAFIATSFFSISIFNHNASIREQNIEIRHQTNSVNRRAELFRNLQFIAANYTIIDFIDHMLIYNEYESYIQKAKETRHFQFYLMENNIVKEDILENLNDYLFLTVRIPIKILEGKAIGKVSLSKIKFEKESSTHVFIPTDGVESTVLILQNEIDHRMETITNLIMKKSSHFYTAGEINPFLKIKISLNMESLLGVVIGGDIELYFTNPEKMEESGANKYKINSSQFEIIGKPKLNAGKEYNLD